MSSLCPALGSDASGRDEWNQVFQPEQPVAGVRDGREIDRVLGIRQVGEVGRRVAVGGLEARAGPGRAASGIGLEPSRPAAGRRAIAEGRLEYTAWVRMNLLPAFPALAILTALGGPAGAQAPKHVRLDYQRQEGAAICPDASAIQAGVAARLGYEPFRDDAEDQLRATIRQNGSLLEARIEMTDARGNVTAERRLVSRRRDCGELASSVALAISIAIDPMGQVHAPSASDPASPPPPLTSPAQAPPQTSTRVSAQASPSPEPSLPVSERLALALVGGLGSAPSPSLGIQISGALRRGPFSLALDLRADLPASSSLQVGEASSSLYLASLAPCLHYRAAAACALASAGAQRVAGHNLIDSRSATDPYLAFGARLAADFPVSARLLVALHGDASIPVTRVSLLVDDAAVWKTPVLVFALGLGVAVIFP
jgi:hypothetical protein